MVRFRKKTTDRVFDEAKLKDAIKDVLIRKKSKRQAALDHQIPRETLRRHVELIMKNMDGSQDLNIDSLVVQRNFNFKAVFSVALEEKLVEHLLICSNMGYGISTDRCREIAYEMAVMNNANFPSSWTLKKEAGPDWMWNSFKRHPNLSLRKQENCSLSRSLSFNKHNVHLFFNNLEKVYRKFPQLVTSVRIFNLDETTTTTVQMSRKIIAQKGARQVHQNTSADRGTLVSTCCIIGASGIVLPPVMIFPGVNFKSVMLTGCYPGTLGLAFKTGWMTSENFVLTMRHFIQHTNSSITNPSLLIYDNHETHVNIEVIDLAKQNGVTIVTIHPHTSHKCQPLDVAVYGPFKKAYDKEINKWLIMNPGKTVTIYEVAGFVRKAIEEAATPQNICSAFRASGIFPFDRDIFPDEEFAATTITNRPNPEGEGTNVLMSQPSNSGINTPDVLPCKQSANVSLSGNTGAGTSTTGGIPSSSASTTGSEEVGPIDFSGMPSAKNKGSKKNGRKKRKTMIATNTPVRDQIAEEQAGKKKISKKKRSNTNSEKAKKKLFKESENSDESEVVSENSQSGGESNEDSRASNVIVPDAFQPLQKPPEEGDFVLIKMEKHTSKKARAKFYVWKVIKKVDTDGDIEVSYFRKSLKSNNFFVPNVPDLASCSLIDVMMILPPPCVNSGTKRQACRYTFSTNFSLLQMG